VAFAGDVACLPTGLLTWKTKTINRQTAIFRQVNKDMVATTSAICLPFPRWRPNSRHHKESEQAKRSMTQEDVTSDAIS
jgi:hypothetical protein